MTHTIIALIALSLIAEIIAVLVLKRRKNQQQVAALSPEQRSLYDAEKAHEVSVAQAQQALRTATQAFDNRVKSAEKALRNATQAYENGVKAAKQVREKAEGMARASLGSYSGKKGTVKLWEDHIETPHGQAAFSDGPIDTTIEPGGKVGTLNLTVKAPRLASVIICDAKDNDKARALAIKIYNASRAFDALRKAREHAISQASYQLEAKRDDRTATNATRSALEATQMDRSAVETAQATLEVARADRSAIDAALEKLTLAGSVKYEIDSSLPPRQKVTLGVGAVFIVLLTVSAATSGHADMVRATAIAEAHAQATAQAQATANAQATATQVAQAHAQATVEVYARATQVAQVHERATVQAHARATARAQAHAHATAQARARAEQTAQALKARPTQTAEAKAHETQRMQVQATATAKAVRKAYVSALALAARQRTDFQVYASHILYDEDACSKADANAQVWLKSLGANSSDAASTYSALLQDAQVCDQAGQMLATLSVPDSLNQLQAGGTAADAWHWAWRERDFWNDAAKSLNNGDLSVVAAARNQHEQAIADMNQSNIGLVTLGIKLNVSVTSITPAPSG